MHVPLPTPRNFSEDTPKTKVTIGVCVRNNASAIREAIESIAQQDFPHESMEIIFVDASEDETLLIIQECSSRIDIPVRIIHTSRKGLGYARNLVVVNATGDYILWVDGDMLLSRDYVGKLVRLMKRHSELGIAKGQHSLKPGRNLLGTLETYARAAGRMVDYSSEKARFKALGTAGSIYRVDAAKQVGGFDEDITGYGEDWDIEMRLRKAGWVFRTIDATYSDHESRGLTWKNLWIRYWRRGYDTHYFLHKNVGAIKHYRMFPLAAIIAGLLHSHKLFVLTRQKIVFLLPLQSFFKMTAWYIGFVNSHLDSHEPDLARAKRNSKIGHYALV